MMTEIINDVKVAETIGFIKGRFGKIQMFNTRNVIGDYLENIYANNGIYIDYDSTNHYVEIFGLTESEFKRVAQECDD